MNYTYELNLCRRLHHVQEKGIDLSIKIGLLESESDLNFDIQFIIVLERKVSA